MCYRWSDVRHIPPNSGSILVFLLGVLGCGAPAPRPATHADFEAIQRQETDLVTARERAFDDAAPCAERCRNATDAARAAARVCEIAERVDDADAQARCVDARASAQASARASDANCQCE